MYLPVFVQQICDVISHFSFIDEIVLKLVFLCYDVLKLYLLAMIFLTTSLNIFRSWPDDVHPLSVIRFK